MTEFSKPGDAVEVLQIWARGSDAAWIGGYVFESDAGATVIVRAVGGALAGAESRWPQSDVRKAKGVK